jgi:AraC-like DNA-binding protein
MSWRDYRRQSRLIRAMAILAEPSPTILETATRVGFGSVSAFTRSFSKHTGETPSSYRQRIGVGRDERRPPERSGRRSGSGAGAGNGQQNWQTV